VIVAERLFIFRNKELICARMVPLTNTNKKVKKSKKNVRKVMNK